MSRNSILVLVTATVMGMPAHAYACGSMHLTPFQSFIFFGCYSMTLLSPLALILYLLGVLVRCRKTGLQFRSQGNRIALTCSPLVALLLATLAILQARALDGPIIEYLFYFAFAALLTFYIAIVVHLRALCVVTRPAPSVTQ